MKCPKTPFGETKVVESRVVDGGRAVRRRRECLDKSGHRFTTYERIEHPNLVIVKNNGDRQPFNRAKLLMGVQRACEKTSVTASQMEELVSDIEEQLYVAGNKEVKARKVGEMVMERLAKLNDVAYVRFASVYRRFKDIKSFEKELNKLKKQH